MPLGELNTLIAIEQIKHEGAEMKREADFWELLQYK